MKLVYILCGMLIWCGTVNAQLHLQFSPETEKLRATIDSLEQELNSAPDSLKWDFLYKISRTYRDFPRKDTLARQEGIAYSLRAVDLAKQEADTINYIKSLNPLIYFYKRAKGTEEKQKEAEKLRRILVCSWGYRIPIDYHQWEGERQVSLRGKLWAHYDSSSTLTVEDIQRLGANNQLKPFVIGDKDLNDYPESWWLRFRLRSQENHGVEHVFYTGEKRNYWDTVEVYVAQAGGTFERHVTGKSLDPESWVVPDRANHFRISVPPKEDITVFMRIKGFPSGFAPDDLEVYHINYEAFLRDRVKTRHTNGIFQGVVLIQLFFFFLLYLATRDHIYGNYAIYILGLSLFILNVNYFDTMEELIQASLYLLAVWLATIGMLMFSHAYLNMKELMPKWKKPLKIFLITFTAISLLIAGILPFFEDGEPNGGLGTALIIMFGLSLFLYFLMVVAASIFLPIWGFRTLIKGYAPAKYYLIATLFLFLGFLLPLAISPFQDSLEEMGFFNFFTMSNLIEGGIAVQLCLFALGVGHKRNLLERERREAMEGKIAMQEEKMAMQEAINSATNRFVPHEFLKTLGKESIVDVNLGDQVEKYVTVFFSDIRGYTSLSEKLTPQQNFLFLNNYLGRVGPIIKTNRGFVNQYYGDGIMALFMDSDSGINSPKDSVLAALEMHKELFQYNQERISKSREPFNIGIGIHTGSLMLGVIGDEKRMDVSVVSDAVNTAARMEGLTKYYGATTIVSGSTFQGMGETDGMNYRFLGQVLVKGKNEPIKIYDFYDGDREDIGLKKENSKKLFQEGLGAYFQKDFKASKHAFTEILQHFPEDQASLSYLNKSTNYLEKGVPDTWTGVEIIERK